MLRYQRVADHLKERQIYPDQWKPLPVLRAALQNREDEFPADILYQIAERCQKNEREELSVDRLIKLVLECERRLVLRITEKTSRISSLNRLRENSQSAFEKSQDLTQKRQLQAELNSAVLEIEESEIELAENRESLFLVRSVFGLKEDLLVPPTTELDSSTESRTDLKLLLVLSVLFALLECFVCFFKPDFVNLFIAIALLSLFTLDYFEKYFIRLLLCLLVLGLGVDVMWLLAHLPEWWQKAHLGDWHRLSVVGTGVLMLLKVISVLLLFKYRTYDRVQRIELKICDRSLSLGGLAQNHVSISIKNSLGVK